MMRGMTEAIQEKYVSALLPCPVFSLPDAPSEILAAFIQARQVIIMINEDPSEPYSATEVFTVGLAYSKGDSVTLTE
jgi:hypothetical protein